MTDLIKKLITEKQILTTKDNELYSFDPHFSQINVPSGTEVDYELWNLLDENDKVKVIHHIIKHQGHSLKSVVHLHDSNHKDYGGQWVLLRDAV